MVGLLRRRASCRDTRDGHAPNSFASRLAAFHDIRFEVMLALAIMAVKARPAGSVAAKVRRILRGKVTPTLVGPHDAWRKYPRSPSAALVVAVLLVAAMLLSLVIGAYPLAIGKLLSGNSNEVEWSVLTQLRAPRDRGLRWRWRLHWRAARRCRRCSTTFR